MFQNKRKIDEEMEVKAIEEREDIEEIKAKIDRNLGEIDRNLGEKTAEKFQKITCRKIQGISLDFALFLGIEVVIWGFLGLIGGRHLMSPYTLTLHTMLLHTNTTHELHTTHEQRRKKREKWEEENIK